jgi:hypothetical protein
MDPDLIAALLGVARHIEETEDEARAGSRAGAGATGASPWALHGRQGIMRMRALVQQRVLKR